ncbi:hypothetical protein CBR_g34793 [Chara braunii]|uniref:Uncharacterized protein n=1 Tax=Chara braunii TaxID=69332 RepID=A0A388LJH1_CHABU|nr:hypothetical protein CBR_g34793 [Chara braunii]|eukprot:GBG82417.1 hypothetical protein CBR_g34793 [Chara braunii]
MSTPTVTVSGPVASPRCTPRCNLGLGFSRGGKPTNGRQMRIFEAAQRVHKTTASVCRQARVAVCRTSQLRCRPCSLPSSAVAVVRRMADIFRKLPLLLLAVFLQVVVVLHVCFVGNAPRRRRRRTSPMKAVRTDSGQGSPRGGGEQVVSRRAVGSFSPACRLSLGVGNSSLLPDLQPLLDSLDEEEREGRAHTVPLGSGSTQEWSWKELCGDSGGVYGQSFTELLAPGLDGEEGHGGSNLSSGLSTGRCGSQTRTVIVNPHVGDDGRQLTAVDRSSKSAGAQQWQGRATSISRSTQGHPSFMQSPAPVSAASNLGRRRGIVKEGGGYLDDVVDDRDGRLVWAEERRKIREGREEAIRRGVERLRMDRQAEEVKEPHAGLPSEDDDDDGTGEAGDRNGGYASPSQNSDGGGRAARRRRRAGTVVGGRRKRKQRRTTEKATATQRRSETFGLNGKERARHGFNFNMDRAVYDEIEGSSGFNETINPKNVADTGTRGGVRLPSTTTAYPEAVGDVDACAGGEDEDEGSTRGSSQTSGSPHGFGKRKSTRQQTFEAMTECKDKHGALMAATMESACKRQCSIQLRQCEALEAEVQVQKTHYATSDEVSKLMCQASQAMVDQSTMRSPVPQPRGGAVQGASAVADVAKAGDGGAEGEDDKPLVKKLRGQRPEAKAMEVAARLWTDDIQFWNQTRGKEIINIMHEARVHLVDVATRVQPSAIRRSITLPHSSIPQKKIEDTSELRAAKERALKVESIAKRAIHGWIFKSDSRHIGYHLAYQYALNHAPDGDSRHAGVGMKLPLWFVGANVVDRHQDDECAAYQEAISQRLVRDFTNVVEAAQGMDLGRVSYERLKSLAEAMRYLLAAAAWIMRMAGDDARSHFDAWVFVQLTSKTTLLAAMDHHFDSHHHVLLAATVMTEKLGRPSLTFAPPPLYIPDWASKCDITFNHDATLHSPMEATKTDWLGTGPPEEEASDGDDVDGAEGG